MMQKLVAIITLPLCTCLAITSCMTNEDVTHNDDKVINHHTTERDELKSWLKQSLKPSKGFEDSEAILSRFINIWEAPKTIAKKKESYQYLLNLEKEGDIAFSKKNYGTAWNRYSTASVYYPSPKLLVKSGDALMLQYINNSDKICKCDTNDLPEEFRRKTIELDYIKYKVRVNYGLALQLVLGGYTKIDYNDEQKLSQNESQSLMDKISCLNDVLDFEGTFADTAILKQCI